MFAGAAFTDSADIKVDTEVVDTLVSLGVVNGYDDGSFKPNGTVTRAEMAKMIYVLRTGNSDASAYNDDKTSFTDIGSHWARGYIKYCQSLGIIAGKSNTKFCPNDKVTAQEAAKMLLVTLGYDATKAGLTGANWASKTNALADENGLLEDVNTSFTAACPRQYAAQLIYNAIDAKTVVLRDGTYIDESATGHPNKTVGEKYMGLSKTEGVLVASGKTGINGQATAKEDSLAVNVLGTTASGAAETTYDYVSDVTFTKVAKDYTALLGQVVKVLYKNGDKSKVYGVFATDDNNVLAGNSTDLEKKTATKVKFDGTEYDVAASTLVTVNGVKKADKTLAEYADVYKDTAATFSLVDNNDDDKYDVLTVFAPSVVKVTYAGSNSITAGKSYKYADENIADGIKKDDYVAIIDKAATKDGKYNITKAETVTGKVEAIKGTDVKINGTWYKQATGADIEDTYSLNDTFTLAVVNGFVYHAEQGDDAISNDKVVLITKADDAKNAGIDAGTQKVKALFADGTEKQITVAQLDKDGNGYKDMKDSATPATAVEAAVNTLYTFTTKSNGDYKLKVMDSTKYDGTLSNIAKIDDGKAYNSSSPASTMRFADSAAIFVVPGNGDDAKVITGKALGTWKNITALNSASTTLYGKKDGGIVYANVGVVVMASSTAAPSSGDVEYGFVTADSSLVKDGDDYYVSMTIWNGSSEVPVKADSYYEFNNSTSAFTTKTDVDDGTAVKNYTNASSQAITVAFAKKTPISYKTTGDGIISEVRPLNVVSGTEYKGAVAVTGYKDGKKYVSLDGTDYDLTSDTVQMFVDTDAKKGETTGSITEANEVHGYYVKNAYAVLNTAGDEVEFILVDTQNNLECNASEDDVKITTQGGAAAAKANDETRVLKLNTATSLKVNAVFVADGSAYGVQAVGAGKVFVLSSTGATKAATDTLVAGDTIRVIAQNGDVVDYSVVA